jgi:hypothetical protein
VVDLVTESEREEDEEEQHERVEGLEPLPTLEEDLETGIRRRWTLWILERILRKKYRP